MGGHNDIFHRAERNLAWFVAILMSFFIFGVIATVIIPVIATPGWNTIPQEVQQDPNRGLPDWMLKPKSELSGKDLAMRNKWERGRLIYKREGCMYCHSQQVRPLDGDIRMFSRGDVDYDRNLLWRKKKPPVVAEAWEYLADSPHFLGTKRTGPDLSRVGGKYTDDWHYAHFLNPREMVPGSIMPAYTWLFTPTGEPTCDARALVFYIQTLGVFKPWIPVVEEAEETLGALPTTEAPRPPEEKVTYITPPHYFDLSDIEECGWDKRK